MSDKTRLLPYIIPKDIADVPKIYYCIEQLPDTMMQIFKYLVENVHDATEFNELLEDYFYARTDTNEEELELFLVRICEINFPRFTSDLSKHSRTGQQIINENTIKLNQAYGECRNVIKEYKEKCLNFEKENEIVQNTQLCYEEINKAVQTIKSSKITNANVATDKLDTLSSSIFKKENSKVVYTKSEENVDSYTALCAECGTLMVNPDPRRIYCGSKCSKKASNRRHYSRK